MIALILLSYHKKKYMTIEGGSFLLNNDIGLLILFDQIKNLRAIQKCSQGSKGSEIWIISLMQLIRI